MLLATVKVKVKKAHCLYIEMCHNICHVLLYFNFFNPHSMECVSEEEKTWAGEWWEIKRSLEKWTKNGSNESKIDVTYGIPLSSLLLYLG